MAKTKAESCEGCGRDLPITEYCQYCGHDNHKLKLSNWARKRIRKEIEIEQARKRNGKEDKK